MGPKYSSTNDSKNFASRDPKILAKLEYLRRKWQAARQREQCPDCGGTLAGPCIFCYGAVAYLKTATGKTITIDLDTDEHKQHACLPPALLRETEETEHLLTTRDVLISDLVKEGS